MHGEREESLEELVEGENNVLEFSTKEPLVEHAIEHISGKVGTHKRSLYELGELGYDSLLEAKSGLAELRKDKEEILDNLNRHVMFSVVGKLKDKLFNQGAEVKRLTDLELKIHKLESAVRFTQATEHLQKQEQAGNSSHEFKKAA